MTPKLLLDLVVRPTLTALAKRTGVPRWHTPEAERLLLAIAIQESHLAARRQTPRGPARSWWQIEPPTALDVRARCGPVADFLDDVLAHYNSLEYCDAAACAVARGILWLDPEELPELGEVLLARDYYLRCWRPGKPRPLDWETSYREAMAAMKS